MTAQYPEKLVNEHPRVKLDRLYLYHVIRGDLNSSNYGWGDGTAFSTQPNVPSNAMRCSALWRGYVATFVLQSDGRLRLTAFEFMLSLSKWKKQNVDEVIKGDFWLVMKPAFFAPRTYVPFRDGVIVEDRVTWFTEKLYGARMKLRPEGPPS